MFKSTLSLISTGFKFVQAPSRFTYPSSLIGESVRAFAMTSTFKGQCKPQVAKESCIRSPLIGINGFGRIGKCLLRTAIREDLNVAKESCNRSPPIGINGFGRIGKCLLRMAIREDLNVVAINEPGAKIEDIAHSLKYDTVHGTFPGNVSINGESCLNIDGKTVRVFNEKDPEKIKWKDVEVEYVIDSTGKFTQVDTAKKHLSAGVKKVIISAPSKDAPTFVKGVNFDKYKKDMIVVSNASCTTNCAAPLIHIINQKYGVEHCLLTTVHAVTSSQHVMDGVKHRSAAGNIVHSTTGAAKAVGIVIPELKGKVNGDSIRVPVLDVSLLKLYITVKKPVKLEELTCGKLWDSEILSYIDDKRVSSDFIGSNCSAIVDLNQVSVMGDKFVTIGAWYDNEMGYSKRLLDLYKHMVKVDKEKPSC